MSKITRSEQVEGDEAYYLSNVQIGADSEIFYLELTSGANKRLYLTSPAHAQRIAIVLTNWVQLYEQRFGAIRNVQPSPQETGVGAEKVGF